MRAGILSALVLAAALAGAANAQVPRGLERNDAAADLQRNLGQNSALSAKQYQAGVDAVQARNFQVAEGIFQEILDGNANHADANFMMGVTKMSLNKWDEARKFLEIAVKKSPKEPDPKSRLGVTLMKLGDLEGAKAQRDDLVKMQKQCKGSCRHAQWIDGGIAMIDGAMPPKAP
jgi:TolA-binding protein